MAKPKLSTPTSAFTHLRINTDAVSALILAGGLGKRMSHQGQGTDKGLTHFRGRPMVAHVIDRIVPQIAGDLIINCNQNLDAYKALASTQSILVADSIEGFAGPLAGLEAGLAATRTEWLVTAPCDTPFLPLNLVEQFLVNANAKQVDLLVARDPQQTHPVFMMVHQSVLSNLRAYLSSGERKVDRWYRGLKHTEVLFSDAQNFANINTLAELRRLE